MTDEQSQVTTERHEAMEQPRTENKKRPNLFFRIIRGIWRSIDFTRRLVLNLLFLFILIAIIVAISAVDENDQPMMADKGALKLEINGTIVEQAHYIEPLRKLLGQTAGSDQQPPELVLSDLVKAVKTAANDQHVTALVLDLNDMTPTGLNKLDELGSAIAEFKKAGKPVVAEADYYGQYQYYLATYADAILMNRDGEISIDGFGRYNLYFKGLLDKIKAKAHIFRVGKYKSAVEPFLRNNMSEAARQANKDWMGDLWQSYLTNITQRRGLDKKKLHDYVYNADQVLRNYHGDAAAMAKATGLVDKLLTRAEVQKYLTDMVGFDKDDKTYNQIDYTDYLAQINRIHPTAPDQDNQIGIIIAKGTIQDGEQPEGEIGGDSTAALLRKARLNEHVKAVVLRVDSPGGSAFASDVIRNEVEALKQAGKPVIASMSTYAASGGYWISAPADKIYASPTTITGSIGIFGMVMTFEDTLDTIGVNADGVGTTPFSGQPGAMPLSDQQSSFIQQRVDYGYQRFIGMVAHYRHMTKEQVNEIAQGRVWSGKEAKEKGLVDELGSFDDAIKAAAELAKLDNYHTRIITREHSAKEVLWSNLLGSAQAWLPQASTNHSPLAKLYRLLLSDTSATMQLNDPQKAYALCLACTL